MESALSGEFLHVVEQAAIACARSIGNGDRKFSDRLAVESMRRTMEDLPIDGTIVIGEGERDEAPMLYVGEKVGRGGGHPAIDIAVDPLEGTNLCATGADNAIAVLAASERGGLLHAPDLYMQKLCVGPAAKGKVHLDAPVAENLETIARSLHRPVGEITVVVLDRPRHARLDRGNPPAGGPDPPHRRRRPVRRHHHRRLGHRGARGDGHRRRPGGGAVRGGPQVPGRRDPGPPDGGFQHRLPGEGREHGAWTSGASTRPSDLAPGQHIIFAACGVTHGKLLRGVQLFGEGMRTSSLILNRQPRLVRFVDTVHVNEGEGITVRF